MTVICQTVTVSVPTTLSAQNMIITPSASPCYDPCTVFVEVIWKNDTGGILTGQTIGITVDGVMPENGSIITGDIPNGQTVTHTFYVTGLVHTNLNNICPIPN